MGPKSTSLKRSTGPALAGLVVAVAGCSTSDPAESAVELIEGDLTDQIGLGPLVGECDEPAETTTGEEFSCTGTTEDGALIKFTAVFESDDAIYIYPINLVVDDELFEAEAAATLGPEFDIEIEPAQIECPEGTTVLEENDQMQCTITDADTGAVFPLTVSFGDYIRDEGFDERFYEVGEQIE